MTHHNTISQPKGFALLITILTLTVVVSVTLAIVELSMKQLELSVSSKDSELAFQAANAGMECARYTRKHSSSTVVAGTAVPFTCMGGSITPVSISAAPSQSGSGNIYVYKTSINWAVTSPEPPRCSDIVMAVMVAGSTGGNLVYNQIKNDFPQYPALSNSKTCGVGGTCTVVSVTGYSSNCTNKDAAGTLKRELLLEF